MHPVIDTTGFGTGEQTPRSVARAEEARRRVVAYLARSGLPALCLTTPGSVAWATGGFGPPVDRGAPSADAWAVVTESSATLVTTVVERDRVLTDYDPARHGFGLVAVDWHDPAALPAGCAEVAGLAPGALASDGHPALGPDVGPEVVGLRLALGAGEEAELRELGALAAGALGDALAAWRPGQSTDREIQGHVAGMLERSGADSPVLIVGADDRVRRLRHPVAVGEVAHELVMAVVVARRLGLHVAVTRFAATRAAADGLRRSFEGVEAIEDAVLAATVPGATYVDVVRALGDAYARAGAPGAWREHYQGGPIGFAQREFEIAPDGPYGPYGTTVVGWGNAVAWNPSLAGGAKCEDTYLVGTDGLERVTEQEGWPTRAGSPVGTRPAMLVVG